MVTTAPLQDGHETVTASAGSGLEELARLDAVTLRSRLLALGTAELDEIFELLGSASVEDLSGPRKVELVSAPGVDRLGPRWRSGTLRLLNLAKPLVYRGKAFEGESGANVFVGGVRFIHCTLRTDLAMPGSLLIDYGVEANPRRVRPMAAEVRVLRDGMLLCRTIWRGSGRVRRILYFTLAPAAPPP